VIPLRLLSLALSWVGMILDLGSRVVYLRGTASTTRLDVLLEREEPTIAKVYHSGPILMKHNLVVSYVYPSVTGKVLT
jgi:hypothetical protein